MRFKSLLIVGILLGISPRLNAHHSFAAAYDAKAEIKVEGEVVSFTLRNPHSWLVINGPDAAGEKQTWHIEWAAAAQLTRAGVTGRTLKVGDQVVVNGRPGHDKQEHRMLMLSVTRKADGFTWGKQPEQVVN